MFFDKLFLKKEKITPQQLTHKANTLLKQAYTLKTSNNISDIKTFSKNLEQFLQKLKNFFFTEEHYAPLQAHEKNIEHFLQQLNNVFWQYNRSERDDEKKMYLRDIPDIIGGICAHLTLLVYAVPSLQRTEPILQ